MAFLDSLGATITNMGNNVSSKTKSVVEVTNINGQIKTCEDQMYRYYTELGRLFYSLHKDDASIEPELAEKIAKVTEAQEAIDHLKNALQKAKGTVVCQACGAELPTGTVFCSKCGTKIENKPIEGSAEGLPKICPKCASENKADAAFCMNCGEKL